MLVTRVAAVALLGGLAILWGLSTAVASGLGVLSEMSALQERPARPTGEFGGSEANSRLAG